MAENQAQKTHPARNAAFLPRGSHGTRPHPQQGTPARHRAVNFLLDTNVVSETTRPQASAVVLEWIAAQAGESLFISAITIAELRRRGPPLTARQKRTALL